MHGLRIGEMGAGVSCGGHSTFKDYPNTRTVVTYIRLIVPLKGECGGSRRGVPSHLNGTFFALVSPSKAIVIMLQS